MSPLKPSAKPGADSANSASCSSSTKGTKAAANRPNSRLEFWYNRRMLGRVLFVDDQPSVIDSLTRAVVGEALEVHAATSGAAALALLDSVDFDVIICDEEMPGMAGSDVLAEARKRFPDVIRIVYTGTATVESAVRAINKGLIYQYLLKPCKPAEIVNVIHAALAERRSRLATKLAVDAAKQQHKALRQLSEQIEAISPILASGSDEPAPVARGGVSPGASRAEVAFGALDPERLSLLTPREREFLRALASGKHVKESAQELQISVHTARNHMKALLRKLGVRSQIELLGKLFGQVH